MNVCRGAVVAGLLTACLLLLPTPGQGERAEVVRHRDSSAARPVHSRSYLGAAERMGNSSFFLFFLASFFLGGLVPILQAEAALRLPSSLRPFRKLESHVV